MAEPKPEYLRRDKIVIRAERVKLSASYVLKRLEQQTSPPQWLVHTLQGILQNADPLPEELKRWRNAAGPALETSVTRCTCSDFPGADEFCLAHRVTTGHGHVRRRSDGVKARCGGPAMCKECAIEQAALNR